MKKVLFLLYEQLIDLIKQIIPLLEADSSV